jgi:hypothetical protein
MLISGDFFLAGKRHALNEVAEAFYVAAQASPLQSRSVESISGGNRGKQLTKFPQLMGVDFVAAVKADRSHA